MAKTITLYQKCIQCNGTGTFQPAHGSGGASIPCNWPGCNASGFIIFGKYVQSEFDTHEIVEATKVSEYNALSSANKERYKLIISAGAVDLSEGTKVRLALWAMFGEGTETRANLEALVGE